MWSSRSSAKRRLSNIVAPSSGATPPVTIRNGSPAVWESVVVTLTRSPRTSGVLLARETSEQRRDSTTSTARCCERRFPPRGVPGGAKAGPGPAHPRRPGVLGAFFDGHVDEIAPLGPGAVVVSHPFEAEQLAEDEPRMGAALTDPAVGGHFLVGRDPLAAVELAELLGRLEGAVVAHGTRPRDRDCARNVPGPLRAFLLVPGGRDEV